MFGEQVVDMIERSVSITCSVVGREAKWFLTREIGKFPSVCSVEDCPACSSVCGRIGYPCAYIVLRVRDDLVALAQLSQETLGLVVQEVEPVMHWQECVEQLFD